MATEADTSRFEGDLAAANDHERAVEAMLRGEALAVDNYVVGALNGDGANPAFAEHVQAVKHREPRRPYGLTIGAEPFLSLLDFNRLAPEDRPLFSDTDRFVSRLGAVAFVRAPAHPARLEEEGVPGTVISYVQTTEGRLPVVQNWTPTGKDNFEAVRALAAQHGINYLAVTSLNLTQEPEITDPAEITAFARENGLALLTDKGAVTAAGNGRILSGSYPIVVADRDGLTLARNRWPGGVSLMQRLLTGYQLHVGESVEPAPGTLPPLEGLAGPELRQAFLAHLGWTALKD